MELNACIYVAHRDTRRRLTLGLLFTEETVKRISGSSKHVKSPKYPPYLLSLRLSLVRWTNQEDEKESKNKRTLLFFSNRSAFIWPWFIQHRCSRIARLIFVCKQIIERSGFQLRNWQDILLATCLWISNVLENVFFLGYMSWKKTIT